MKIFTTTFNGSFEYCLGIKVFLNVLVEFLVEVPKKHTVFFVDDSIFTALIGDNCTKCSNVCILIITLEVHTQRFLLSLFPHCVPGTCVT